MIKNKITKFYFNQIDEPEIGEEEDDFEEVFIAHVKGLITHLKSEENFNTIKKILLDHYGKYSKLP